MRLRTVEIANRLKSYRDLLFGIVLVGVTVLAYQPAWNGKPLLDDADHLITDPELRSVRGLISLWIAPPPHINTTRSSILFSGLGTSSGASRCWAITLSASHCTRCQRYCCSAFCAAWKSQGRGWQPQSLHFILSRWNPWRGSWN